MKRLLVILLSLWVVFALGACSKKRIDQAQVLSQAEIDAHNGTHGQEEPEDPEDPENPENPENPEEPTIPLLSDYYVSEAGDGKKNGSSEADAMDLTTFRDYVRKEEGTASQEKVDALDGVTFHFAAGTYPMWDAEHPDGLDIGFVGASKVVKLTLEGAAGTVFTGSGQYRILTVSSQTRLILKGITLTSGYTTTNGGAIYASDCSLSLQDCTVSNNQSNGSSSKNGNNGGAIYLSKTVTSASFTDCVFSGNRIVTTSTDQYGGAVRLESAAESNDVTFDRCTFTGNFAKQAACISVNAKTRLRINHCVFSGNSANSRGMIQMAGGVVFINESTFYNNQTIENNGWGVNLHGKGHVCLNNCTFYGNGNDSTTEGNNNVSVNGYHSLLMTNCTLIESCQLGLLRIDDAAGKQVLCNNILINTSGKTVLIGNTSAQTLSAGHNAMSGVSGFSSFTAHDSDMMTCTEDSFNGHTYQASSGVYAWNGPLVGFSPASQANVTKAMTDDFDIELSGVMSGIGREFFDWLDGMTPKGYAVDGRGEARGAAFWPGAYQGEGGQDLPGDSLIDMDPVIIH